MGQRRGDAYRARAAGAGGPEQMLVSSFFTPGWVYAPFLHPWSTGREIYYNVSLRSAYTVMLMHTLLP